MNWWVRLIDEMSWEGAKKRQKKKMKRTKETALLHLLLQLHCLFQLEQVEQQRLTNNKTHNVT